MSSLYKGDVSYQVLTEVWSEGQEFLEVVPTSAGLFLFLKENHPDHILVRRQGELLLILADDFLLLTGRNLQQNSCEGYPKAGIYKTISLDKYVDILRSFVAEPSDPFIPLADCRRPHHLQELIKYSSMIIARDWCGEYLDHQNKLADVSP